VKRGRDLKRTGLCCGVAFVPGARQGNDAPSIIDKRDGTKCHMARLDLHSARCKDVSNDGCKGIYCMKMTLKPHALRDDLRLVSPDTTHIHNTPKEAITCDFQHNSIRLYPVTGMLSTSRPTTYTLKPASSQNTQVNNRGCPQTQL
jgi:hypothetical protein